MGKPDRQRSLQVTIDRPEKATAPVDSILTEKPSSHSYTISPSIQKTCAEIFNRKSGRDRYGFVFPLNKTNVTINEKGLDIS